MHARKRAILLFSSKGSLSPDWTRSPEGSMKLCAGYPGPKWLGAGVNTIVPAQGRSRLGSKAYRQNGDCREFKDPIRSSDQKRPVLREWVSATHLNGFPWPVQGAGS